MSARSSPTPPQAPSPVKRAPSPLLASPAKKARVGDEESYATFKEWLDAVGPQKVRENLEERYDAAFGTKTFAEVYEDDDGITSWEGFDEWCRDAGKEETETCLDHMDGMVKLIRDQRELIAALFAKLPMVATLFAEAR